MTEFFSQDDDLESTKWDALIPPPPELRTDYSSPTEEAIHKLNLAEQMADNVEDWMSARIAKNYVGEGFLHPAYTFAQSIKTPIPRRQAIAAFSKIIHDAPTSTLPVITPDITDYSKIIAPWLVSANRTDFYVWIEDPSITELVDCDAIWGSTPKIERFSIFGVMAATAAENPDEELVGKFKEYSAYKVDQCPEAELGIAVAQKFLAKYLMRKDHKDWARQMSPQNNLSHHNAFPVAQMLIEDGKDYTAAKIMALMDKGGDAVDLLRQMTWTKPSAISYLPEVAMHDVNMPLTWRIDVLTRLVGDGLVGGKDLAPVQYKIRLLTHELASGKEFSDATDKRPGRNY